MKIIKQLFLIFLICIAGELVSKILPFPFPSSVAALLIMLALFIAGVLRPESVRETAEFLLANLAFLFIPSGVAIIDKYSAVKGNISALLFICVMSTIITFAAAAYTVTAVIKLMERGNKA